MNSKLNELCREQVWLYSDQMRQLSKQERLYNKQVSQTRVEDNVCASSRSGCAGEAVK